MSPARQRAALVAAALTALFTTAGALSPDARGLGTHEQLGLPPCPFFWMTSLPCPFCGYTTAFSALVQLQGIDALRTQPAGALLALSLLSTLAIALVDLIRGSDLLGRLRSWSGRRSLRRWAVLLMLCGWIYKVAVVLSG